MILPPGCDNAQRLSFLKKWVPLLADSCEALSFIPLHIVSLVAKALQSVPPGKDKGRLLAMSSGAPSALPAPYLSSTGSEFSCDRLRSTDPRPACSTGWKASHPPVGILRPSLVCRSHRHSPCGFPSALQRHRRFQRPPRTQAASSRKGGRDREKRDSRLYSVASARILQA